MKIINKNKINERTPNEFIVSGWKVRHFIVLVSVFNKMTEIKNGHLFTFDIEDYQKGDLKKFIVRRLKESTDYNEKNCELSYDIQLERNIIVIEEILKEKNIKNEA